MRLLRSDLPQCGGTLSVPELLQLAAEAEIIPVVLGDGGGITAYGRTRRTAENHGWLSRTINGLPHWTPPTWIDPTQQPQRNTRIA